MDIKQNSSLKPHNTFGIDADARYFSAFSSVDALEELLRHSKNLEGAARVLLLGGGSNLLFTKDVDGFVLKNEIPGIGIVNEDEKHAYVKAGAGVNWHTLVKYCIDKNLGGMENLSLIPGNVGASPMQNIGAYGVELKDVFHELEAYHLKDKAVVTFNKAACGFGYRESVFKGKLKDQFVITNVVFRLDKQPTLNTAYGAITQELEAMQVTTPTIQSVSQAVINIRTSKLPNPAEIGNAGSFFKNPEVENEAFNRLQAEFPGIVGYDLKNGHTKLAAGWLIEHCGWKGYREGDAGCHNKQALVLVNYGNATGEQIYSLSAKIIDSVKQQFGVLLSREVNIV